MRRVWLIVAAVAIVLLALGYQLIAPRSHALFPPRASNGVEYVLYVHVPAACRDGGCQALYVLDGLAWLPTFAKLNDELVDADRTAPLVLVGIGYRDMVDTGDLRKLDFTPAFGRTPGTTGGADAFIDILRSELIPYAEAHLSLETSGRGLAGHSYGGLFAAYTLAREPDLFDRYLIMSPALWFDDGKIYATPLAPTERKRWVFVAADTPREGPRSDMAEDSVRLSELLSSQSYLTVSRTLVVGRSHNGMVAPDARQGLLALYGRA